MELADATHLTDNTLQTNLEALDQREMMSEILRKMPKDGSLLLTLYHLEDSPVKEIVKITGLNESNVKVKLFRARKTFKELLERHYRINKKSLTE